MQVLYTRATIFGHVVAKQHVTSFVFKFQADKCTSPCSPLEHCANLGFTQIWKPNAQVFYYASEYTSPTLYPFLQLELSAIKLIYDGALRCIITALRS